jgi:hypothetical protein
MIQQNSQPETDNASSQDIFIPIVAFDGLGDFDGDYSDDQHDAANSALDAIGDVVVDLTIQQ